MSKYLLFQNSSTQRVTVTFNNDGTVLITKEYRKSSKDAWRVGKGVTIPEDSKIKLSNVLRDDVSEVKRLEE